MKSLNNNEFFVCPSCGETLSGNTLVCKFCKSLVSRRERLVQTYGANSGNIKNLLVVLFAIIGFVAMIGLALFTA